MIQIELTNFELFKNFDEFDIEGSHIDLHNDFKCDLITFQNKKRELVLSFKAVPRFFKNVKQIDIVFEDITIESFLLKNDNELPGEWTINNIYRGRFEEKNALSEISDDGRFYYYIDFYQDYSFELFAKKVLANIFLNDA